MTPEVGKTYRLKQNVGNEQGGLHLVAGLTGEALAIVDADTDHVGGVVIALPDRNWACPLPEFDTLFEEVV